MTPIATAISAGALDAALHDRPTRGDLAREIMARVGWLRDHRGVDAMVALTGGQCLGPDHLARLREEWHNNQEMDR